MVHYDWCVGTAREIFSLDESKKIASIDAPSVAKDCVKYVNESSEEYYLALNTYGHIVKTIDSNFFEYFHGFVLNRGLLQWVKLCDDHVTDVLVGRAAWSDEFTSWVSHFLARHTQYQALLCLRVLKRFSGKNVELLEDESLKSFYRTEADNLKADKADKELPTILYNAYDLLLCSDNDNDHEEQTVRELVLHADEFSRWPHLEWDWLMFNMIEARPVSSTCEEDVTVPTGATQDSCNCYRCKRIAIDEFHLIESHVEALPVNAIAPRINVPAGGNTRKIVPVVALTQWTDTRGRTLELSNHAVRPRPVPKSYKAARLIAVEPARINAHALIQMQEYLDTVARVTPQSWGSRKRRLLFPVRRKDPCNKVLDDFCLIQHECMWLNAADEDWLHGQNRNRVFARIGSLTGMLATIDLSHASDSNRKCIVKRIMRSAPDLLKYAPKWYVDANGKRRRLRMFATSGFALTFYCEACVFLKIAVLSYWLAWPWLKDQAYVPVWDAIADPWNCSEVPQRPATSLFDWIVNTLAVYGDDIGIAVLVVPTLLDILADYGFVVNEDKTFFDGPFRESCGYEYWQGCRVDHRYWPRKGMKLANIAQAEPDWSTGTDDDISRLIAYSNMLGDMPEGVDAQQFLLEYINRKLGYPSGDPVKHMSVLPSPYAQGDRFVKANDPFVAYRIGKTRITTTSILPVEPADTTGKNVLRPSDDAWRPFLELGSNPKLLVTGVKEFRDLAKRHRACLCRHIDVDAFVTQDAYLSYLKYGPFYATPLDKALGISTSRLSLYDGTKRIRSIGTVTL